MQKLHAVLKQNLEAAHHKTIAVQPLTSYLTIHTNKSNKNSFGIKLPTKVDMLLNKETKTRIYPSSVKYT